MPDHPTITVDRRAFSDLQRIALERTQEVARLETAVSRCRTSLDASREELEQATAAQQEARDEIARLEDELEHQRSVAADLVEDVRRGGGAHDALLEDNRELTQALQQAQRSYLAAVERLRALEGDNAETPSTREHRALQEQLEREREKLARVTGSRAWRAVTAYRNVVKRFWS